MPDSIIALKSRSGEIFRRMVVLFIELRDSNFYKTELTKEEIKRNKAIALEISSLTEENNNLMNEIDYYLKTGMQKRGVEEIKIDYSKLTDNQLQKELRNNQSYLCRARAELATITDESKRMKKSKRINDLVNTQNELRQELNNRSNVI